MCCSLLKCEKGMEIKMQMKYKSTRGKNAEVLSAEAIVKGIAKDGGLFVPTSIPAISKADFDAMVNEDYRARAERIFAMYLTDFTADEIKDCVTKAYSKENSFFFASG